MTLAELAADLKTQFSTKAKVRAKSTRELTRDATFYGLADVQPNHPATVTVRLPKGTYYVAELTPDLSRATVQTLKVGGCRRHHGQNALPRTRATVTMDHDRFIVSGRLPATGSIRVRNAADTLHLMFLLPVKEGATVAEVQKLFESDSDDQGPFLDGPAAGVGVLSRGRQAVLGYSLPKGTYVLVCFVADEETGMAHAQMGMHKVVRLR